MRTFFLAFTTIVLFACNSQSEVKPNEGSTPANRSMASPDCNIALKFINDYVEFTSGKKTTSDSTWIKNNSLLTDNFKTIYKNLLDSAQKKDPELGLDFDPILDAQDFPDKGFELVSCDTKAGYVTVSGKGWKEFVLVLKLALQDNKWLIDGSGVINIPFDKRAKR